VGIAGGQTGIYPLDSPGGWRIIGRTTLRLFDHTRGQPELLRPGDRVRFVLANEGATL
jgi:allophanate hydrolase subunit 1